jgi:hypothetical protein
MYIKEQQDLYSFLGNLFLVMENFYPFIETWQWDWFFNFLYYSARIGPESLFDFGVEFAKYMSLKIDSPLSAIRGVAKKSLSYVTFFKIFK